MLSLFSILPSVKNFNIEFQTQKYILKCSSDTCMVVFIGKYRKILFKYI